MPAALESRLVGFFLRVRPEAATRLTDEAGSSFEGVEVTGPNFPENDQGRYLKGWTYQGASEEDAARLEATGLFERIDDSFMAVRVRDEARPPIGNDRVLGVVDELVGPVPGGTDAEFMLYQLAVQRAALGLDEETFRDQLRADPRVRIYADAEFPELRFYIGRAEAIGLIAADIAEPIYGDEDGLASLLGTD